MPARPSMARVYVSGMIILVISAALTIAYLAVHQQYTRFEAQSSELDTLFYSQSEQNARNEVRRIIEYVDFTRTSLTGYARDRLRARMAYVYQYALTAYHELGEDRPALKTLLQHTLQELSVREDGVFFMVNSAGELLIDPGQDDTAYSHALSGFLPSLKDMIAQAKDSGESFMIVNETLAAGQKDHRHVIYLRYFAPLDCIIGTDEYVSAVEEQVQQNVLARIAARTPDTAFVSLVVNEQGRPMFAGDSVTDTAAIFRLDDTGENQSAASLWSQLRDIADDHSVVTREFVSPTTGERSVFAIERIPEWNWYVVAHASMAQLDRSLQLAHGQLKTQFRVDIGLILGVAVFSILLSLVVGRRIMRRVAWGFDQFNRFFSQAKSGGDYIDSDQLPYTEFVYLAETANAALREKKLAREALQDSEERLRMALELSGYYIWEFDIVSRRVLVASGFWSRLGYPEKEGQAFPFEGFDEYVHEDDRDVLGAVFARNLVGFESTGIEGRLRDVNGKYHWFLIRGGMVKSNSVAKSRRALGTVVDITQHKELEIALVHARNSADDASFAKSQFLSAMSHELHTPLNGVIGYTQILLRQNGLSDDQRSYLQSIKDSADELQFMISDILNLAKIESGQILLHEEICRVRGLMQTIADISKRKAEARDQRYTWEVAPDVPAQFIVDTRRLRQLLTNVIDMSIRSGNADATNIQVEYLAISHQVMFVVTDRGMPLKQVIGEQVFPDVGKSEGKGSDSTVLGFGICQRIAAAMGGELELNEREGGGNLIQLLLPVKQAQSDARAVSESDAPVCLSTEVDPGMLEDARQAAIEGDIDRLQQWLTDQRRNASANTADWLDYLQKLVNNFDLDTLQDQLTVDQGID